MARRDPPDDDDFASLMARDGVRPLDRSRPAAPPPGPSPPAGAARAPGPPPAAAPPAGPDLAPAVARLEARVAELEAALAAARDGEAAAAAARLRAEAALASGLAEARGEAAALADAIAARDALDAERKALQRALVRAQDETREARAAVVPFADLLAERGLGEGELDVAFFAWAEGGRLGELLPALAATDAEAARAFLEERVSLVCGDPGCPPLPGAAAIPVPAARCDVCGGSDIRRAAARFFDRCAAAGVRRVRVVGGSPTYHTVLRDLARLETRVDLKLVRGNARRTQQEARADQRHADLVIIWGGTILDHAISGLYDPGLGRVLPIAHRGIARMLDLAAESL